ncbi:Fc.00g100310.m01.CDS01 [Cosmosporella sp. VM-42]
MVALPAPKLASISVLASTSLINAMSCRTPWRCCPSLQRRQAHSLCNWAPSFVASASKTSRIAAIQSRAIHNDGPKQINPLVNPPAVTRPPPLTLPRRRDFESTPKYYFELGKGYLKFYKEGLKNILASRRLLKEKLSRTPPDDRPSIWNPHYVPRTFSRADWVLLWRVRHDMLRLPLFGLMLIVIGEFTVLVVAYVDGAVPYTCRIPTQIFATLEKSEQRRKLAFDDFEAKYPHGVLSPRVTPSVARAHVLRTLHISGGMWDYLRVTPPGMWQAKGRYRMAYLEGDDKNIVEDGGPMGLEYDELRIACAERGIDTLGKSETELRGWLGDWLRLTAAEDIVERRRRMAVLLLTRPEHWPESRDFGVPEWQL